MSNLNSKVALATNDCIYAIKTIKNENDKKREFKNKLQTKVKERPRVFNRVSMSNNEIYCNYKNLMK